MAKKKVAAMPVDTESDGLTAAQIEEMEARSGDAWTTFEDNGEPADALMVATKPKFLSRDEVGLILDLNEEGLKHPQIAQRVGRSTSVVTKVIAKYRPSVNLAKHTIRARAAELVNRVIDKASVAEAIDVLSRPNIGVLDPAKQGGSSVGVYVSVGLESLGAVNKTHIEGEVISERKALPAQECGPEGFAIDATAEEVGQQPVLAR